MRAREKPTDPTTDRLEIVYRKPSELKPNPKNARVHPEAQIAEIEASIRRFGYTSPVLIDEELTVRCGEGRWKAATRLGLEDMPTIMRKGLTAAQWRALELADNRIPLNSGWNPELLKASLAEIDEAGETLDGLGFKKDELKDLLGEDDPLAALEVKEIETHEVGDRFWISIRGPLAAQADAIKKIDEALAGIAGVEVEMGTIALDF
jgi:ParB-like chromosome segregation protein Spo0J